MAFTARTDIRIEILGTDLVQLSRRRVILEDGVEVGAKVRRVVVAPGSDISNLPKRVRRVLNALFTPELREVYRRLNILQRAKEAFVTGDATQEQVDQARANFLTAKAAYEEEIGEETPISEPEGP